jgi:hypothetical protein
MVKIFMITLAIILFLSALVLLFLLGGQGITNAFPNSGFANWWRKQIVDENPSEE